MVIVSVAEWLIAPAPLVDADTETLVVPIGVPGFPTRFPELHEVSPDTAARKINTPKSREPRRPRPLRAEKPKSIAKSGNSIA
jgi:hypothetical protein